MSDVRERFERDGFVAPLQAMSAEQAAGYRTRFEDAEQTFGHEKEFRQSIRRYPNLLMPFIDEITRLPTILDAVSQILGDDLLVLDPPFFIKEAETKHFVSWHQDLHYWGLSGDDEVTAWVALSPATAESGCMRFVPGSHTTLVDHVDTHADDNLLTRGQEVAVKVDEADAVDAALQPGEFSLHHGRVFHASHPNQSKDRRIGLAIRYIPTSMGQIDGATMGAMLVKGEDRYGNFRACRPPSGVFTDEDRVHWREIMGARHSVVYRETN